MTLLIASAFADTVEELDLPAASAWRAGTDAVEVRIDTLRDTPSQLSQFLRGHSDRQWLITCRSRSEGGRFAGNGIEAGMRALEAVEGTNAWIDVELAAWRSDGELRRRIQSHLDAHPTAKLILSAHFLEGATTNLTSLIEETLREGPQVIAKVAYTGVHIADSFQALDLMHCFGPRVVAICMGEAGVWTRVLAPKLGAFATFASLSQMAPTAPGQGSVEELREYFGWDRIDAGTRVFGVGGAPIAHSLSPRLFNHWFRQHNCNAVFVPLRIGTDHGGLAHFLAETQRRPWLLLNGLSVTIPHKVEALRWAGDAADPMSRGIGAANTLVLGDAGPSAYNTDCYAAVDSLAAALGRQRSELAGLTVDVLGMGGAARAACYGLAEMGCRVTAFARSCRNAQDFERWGVAIREWAEREKSSGELLVNCTPMGMWPNIDESPMPAIALRDRKLVFDLIYRPLRTKLLLDAASLGCQTLGGLDMFVRQAATQFALWTGQTPDATGACRMLEMGLECETYRAARKNSVALIGARGSGKTTVGRLLARILGIRHADIDEMVVASSGRTIRQIFAEQGEEEFRRLESDTVRLATGTKTPAVFSMGGGAVMDLANMSQVARVARIVWLAAPAVILAGRIAQDAKSGENRPRLTKHDALTEMVEVLRAREPLYRAAADFIVDTSQLDAADVALRIASWIAMDSSLRSE